jgi:5-methylcytosine-specific restriction enzyme A
MPTAYKRCPKCSTKIERQFAYCEACKPKVSATYNKQYNKSYRNQEAQKFYESKEWKAVRQVVLERSPFCVECNRPAVIVDHIKEIRDGGAPLDLANLQPLCRACHNSKTVKEKNTRNSTSELWSFVAFFTFAALLASCINFG